MHSISLKQLILVLIFFLVAIVDARAQEESLKGLESVSVLVESLSVDALDAGLTKQELQTHIEERLIKHGIDVAEDESVLLYLNLNMISFDWDNGRFVRYLYHLELELMQFAFLYRDPEIVEFVTTWETATSGYVSPVNVKTTIEKLLDDKMDEFLDAYNSVNP